MPGSLCWAPDITQAQHSIGPCGLIASDGRAVSVHTSELASGTESNGESIRCSAHAHNNRTNGRLLRGEPLSAETQELRRRQRRRPVGEPSWAQETTSQKEKEDSAGFQEYATRVYHDTATMVALQRGAASPSYHRDCCPLALALALTGPLSLVPSSSASSWPSSTPAQGLAGLASWPRAQQLEQGARLSLASSLASSKPSSLSRTPPTTGRIHLETR